MQSAEKGWGAGPKELREMKGDFAAVKMCRNCGFETQHFENEHGLAACEVCETVN